MKLSDELTITLVPALDAERICREISQDLPEYFGQPEANERYAKGMRDRVSFAASYQNEYIGLLTLEFPFPNNANIYWMAVKRQFHGQSIGTRLIEASEPHARDHGCLTMTVETLSPKNANEDYLKSYHFYEKSGFKPLFELNTYGPDFLMVYMLKVLRSR